MAGNADGGRAAVGGCSGTTARRPYVALQGRVCRGHPCTLAATAYQSVPFHPSFIPRVPLPHKKSSQALNKSIASLERVGKLFPRRAMQGDHDLALAYDLRSSAWFSKGDCTQAVNDAVRASNFEPEWFKPHMVRGMALAAAGRKADAIAAYEQAARLIPPNHIKVRGCSGWD